MEIIKFEEIKKLNLNYNEMYNWAKDLIKNKKNSILPPKISMKLEGHKFFNVMPSIIPEIGAAGVKMVTRFPERVPALDADILLYDANTGDSLALMDGMYITAMRTGAIAALAINTLAKKNYKKVSMIGLGNVARSTLEFLVNTNPDRKIDITLMKFNDEELDFIDRFKKYSNLSFNIVDNYTDLFSDADVIISCVTFAESNFIEEDVFKKGCLLVPVHTMGFQNCDINFDKEIVDDIGHVEGFKNFDKFKECCELTDVLNGKPGRVNDEERIIAYNIGIALEDVYFAKKIYDLLNKKNEAEMKENRRFWV